MASAIKIFLVACLCFDWCGALPWGAPSFACSSMTPYHFAFQPQPLEESPFAVRQSKLKYTAGNDSVVVALTASKDRTFKGFLVKAFNPVSNRPIGKFREDTAVSSRDFCHAATHVNAQEKSIAVVHWLAEDVEEDNDFVVFEATFVESFRKFYVGVESVFRGKPARKEIESLRKSMRQKESAQEEPAGKLPPRTPRPRLFWK